MTSRYHHHHHHVRAPSAHSSSSTAATAGTAQTVASTASTEAAAPTGAGAHPHGGGHSTMGTTSVRRNLFQHHLSRRPASAASSSASTVALNGAYGVSSHGPTSTSTSAAASSSSLSTGPLDNGEIVVKDKNGGYKLDIPILPPVVVGDDGDEGTMEGVEDGRPSAGSGATGVSDDTEISGREKEKIEASLVEMMCRNRSRQISSEPAEILNLIHQSLRKKVAALEEDKWMYEVEDDIRP
ncbi:hypothetical protein VTN00DRAFT_8649 [Thermoascus crustaceus]|uniref:uncharacterized protein n=1 Tax=Thermoascus crustaceus TaxID=5088 RepID=UPI0037422CD3